MRKMQNIRKFCEKNRNTVFDKAKIAILNENIKSKKVYDAIEAFLTNNKPDFQNQMFRVNELIYNTKTSHLFQTCAGIALITSAIQMHNLIKKKFSSSESSIITKYGQNITILAGDALLFEGLYLLNQFENSTLNDQVPKLNQRSKIPIKMKNPSENTREKDIFALIEERKKAVIENARKEIVTRNENPEVQKALTYLTSDGWNQVSNILGPALISFACESVKGNPKSVFSVNTSLTLITIGIKIHDDILDNSKTKMGTPTIYGKFGTSTALATGRELILRGFKKFYEISNEETSFEKLRLINKSIKQSFFEFGSAEALELELRGNLSINPEDYWKIIEMKSAISEMEARIGGILGDGSQTEIHILGKYGRTFGILVAIREEIIDSFEIDELQHRIKNECLPLPLIYAFRNQKIKKRIMGILQQKELTKEKTDTLNKNIFGEKGIIPLKTKIEQLKKEAYQNLNQLQRTERRIPLEKLLKFTLEDL